MKARNNEKVRDVEKKIKKNRVLEAKRLELIYLFKY